jgi:hypothetical protein
MVRGIAVKRVVLVVIIGGEVRIPASYEVEQNGPVAFSETRREIAPHGLVAAKAVCKHHRGSATAVDMDIVALADVHGFP